MITTMTETGTSPRARMTSFSRPGTGSTFPASMLYFLA